MMSENMIFLRWVAYINLNCFEKCSKNKRINNFQKNPQNISGDLGNNKAIKKLSSEL